MITLSDSINFLVKAPMFSSVCDITDKSLPVCPMHRYMCSSVMQRAMIAPTVWILVTLLDGKCFVCAFSNSIDPEKFPDLAANITTYDALQHFLAKIPCKHDELMRNNTFRKVVSRYLKCCSQVSNGHLLAFGPVRNTLPVQHPINALGHRSCHS